MNPSKLFIIRMLITALLGALPALASSCASREPLQACEMFHRSPVIFRGRVIDELQDSPPDRLGWKLYRIRVDESFKGLATATKEMLVDPGNFRGSQVKLQAGSDYLIYADPGTISRAATLGAFLEAVRGVANPRPRLKELPDSWKHLRDAPVVEHAGDCSPSRIIRIDDPDLRSLRRFASDRSAYIRGGVIQNWDGRDRIRDFVPVSGANVTASQNGRVWRTQTDLDGSYVLPNIPTGKIHLLITKSGFGAAIFPRVDSAAIDVPPIGCAVANASLQSSASISGRILNADGSPAQNVFFRLGYVHANRPITTIPGTETSTGFDGRYTIQNVPVGRVVVGVNIDAAPTATQPFDAVYAPGTSTLGAARICCQARRRRPS